MGYMLLHPLTSYYPSQYETQILKNIFFNLLNFFSSKNEGFIEGFVIFAQHTPCNF